MKRIILLLAMIVHVISIFAYTFSSSYNGKIIYYNNAGEGKCKVTYYSTNTTDNNTAYQGSIEIPSSVTYNGSTCEVVEIDGLAFNGCKNLTSIVIPNSVLKIGGGAFQECSGLTSVSLGEGVTTIESSGFAFSTRIMTPVYNSHIFAFLPRTYYSSYTVPEGITKIAPNAFSEHTHLTSVTLPSTLIEIGEYAFAGSTQLTDVLIPDQVKNINSSAFSGCTSLNSINIPSSVDSIGSDAFTNTGWYRNSSNGLLYIDDCLVQGKGTLTGEISVKEGTRLIASSVFNGKTTITKIYLPNSIRFIGGSVFRNCTGLTSINLPSSIVKIGNFAFNGCSSLQEITLPTSLKEIPTQMMMGCKTLTNLYIPSSVKSVGSMAFYNCTGLTKITIAGTLNNVGSSAFSGCSNITELVYEEGVESTIYTGLTNLTSVSLPTSLKKIGRSSFSGCSKLIAIQIPENVIAIGSNAFDGCSKLNAIQIPGNVTSIGSYAFNNCIGLKEIVIPNKVDSIYDHAFYNCNKITDLNLGKSVSYIGTYAFYGCLGLTELTIPKSLKYGSYAFQGCNNIQTLTYEEGTSTIIGVGVRSASSVSIPESATIIDKYAFSSYTKLNAISLPARLKEISSYAFSGCSNISEIKLPSTVQKIGNYAFDGCSALSKVEISDIDAWAGIQFDGASANPLYYAKSLYLNDTPVTDIKLSSNAKSIGDYAFYGMSGLKSIEIPSSVNSLGKYFVSGCTNLKNLKVWWDNPITIDSYTFSGVTSSNINLTVSRGAKSNYTSAQYWNAFMIEETSSNFKRFDKDGNIFETTLSIYDDDVENDKVTLIDEDKKIVIFNDIELNQITYTRNFKNTGWQELYVPFAMNYNDWKNDFEVGYIEGFLSRDTDNDGEIDETIYSGVKITEGTLLPNTPYIIRAKTTGNKTITLNNATLYATEENSIDCSSTTMRYVFKGVYESESYASVDDYPYYLNNSMFNRVPRIVPFRWTLRFESRGTSFVIHPNLTRGMVRENDGTPFEEYVENNQDLFVGYKVYTLDGRMIDMTSEPLKPGFYVKNGKKVLVK